MARGFEFGTSHVLAPTCTVFVKVKKAAPLDSSRSAYPEEPPGTIRIVAVDFSDCRQVRNFVDELDYGYQASAGQMGAGSTAVNAGQLMSISGTINSTTESAAYTYDNLGRLVTSNQTSNGASTQRRFHYDCWGNRGAVYDAISGGTLIQNVALAQSGGVPTNRIAALSLPGWYGTYTYDASGNVTWDGMHSYQHDAENRIVSVDGGATGQYAYDLSNQRYKKVAGGATIHYIWQGSQVIAEHNGSNGAVLIDYVYSGPDDCKGSERHDSILLERPVEHEACAGR